MDQPHDTQLSSPLRPSVREEGPAVTIHFEKAQNRIQKFREGHPGPLGVTQIMLGLFNFGFIIILTVQFQKPSEDIWFHITAAFLVLIAGALAIACDKTLRLPLIKACLGMEVLGSAYICFILFFFGSFTVVNYPDYQAYCEYHFENETHSQELRLCQKYEIVKNYVVMEMDFVFLTQVAVSITIASYCCKAVQCCGAPRSVPVISVQQPSQQAEG
ncbi:uncharacterized protein LOC121305730 isoform X2 [Polyodon spathula]|uniref:uncharacterized protein LOC121305730 isoform X2 n=1 Tax=Polyodon spathula TaxID=7913 RepID=UPI001B7F5DBE|nr:uncharacterized protein LOC121305730 isoform X2 [Polyodon spathula]